MNTDQETWQNSIYILAKTSWLWNCGCFLFCF